MEEWLAQKQHTKKRGCRKPGLNVLEEGQRADIQKVGGYEDGEVARDGQEARVLSLPPLWTILFGLPVLVS